MGTLAAQLYDAQQKFGSVKKSNADKNSQDFYLVVIFRSETDLNGFIAAAGIPNNRYQSGEDFKVKLGLVNAEGEPINYEQEAEAIEASLAQGAVLDRIGRPTLWPQGLEDVGATYPGESQGFA
jgi:hypothetical protein